MASALEGDKNSLRALERARYTGTREGKKKGIFVDEYDVGPSADDGSDID